jgi:hypothetical protein|tara:strand:- start:15960 stop:16349 length:390 start_codon:yes stop_codon:yes gene_type:complete
MSIKKQKYDRRRAMKAELLKRSSSHEGYCKYLITIGEKDGTIWKQPVYGKDMQDALSRVIKKELTVKVERRLESNVGLIFLVWLVVMGAPAIFADADSPWFLLYTFGSVLLLTIISVWWYSHINKGEDK